MSSAIWSDALWPGASFADPVLDAWLTQAVLCPLGPRQGTATPAALVTALADLADRADRVARASCEQRSVPRRASAASLRRTVTELALTLASHAETEMSKIAAIRGIGVLADKRRGLAFGMLVLRRLAHGVDRGEDFAAELVGRSARILSNYRACDRAARMPEAAAFSLVEALNRAILLIEGAPSAAKRPVPSP